MARITRLTIILTLMALSFAWGFLSHREKVFPFPQLRRLAVAAGLVREPQTQRTGTQAPAAGRPPAPRAVAARREPHPGGRSGRDEGGIPPSFG